MATFKNEEATYGRVYSDAASGVPTLYGTSHLFATVSRTKSPARRPYMVALRTMVYGCQPIVGTPLAASEDTRSLATASESQICDRRSHKIMMRSHCDRISFVITGRLPSPPTDGASFYRPAVFPNSIICVLTTLLLPTY